MCFNDDMVGENITKEMLQDFRLRLEPYVPPKVLEIEMQELEEKYG